MSAHNADTKTDAGVEASAEAANARDPPRSARLFFAFWPSPAMQTALAVAADVAVIETQNAGSGVRRVPTANFHLTLAFLGSVPLSRVAEAGQVAAQCVQTWHPREVPIEVVLDGIEHWRKPQVLVATASVTPPAATALAEALTQSLIDAGFNPDPKPFRVHATVARKVRRVIRKPRIEPVRWRFESLHLIASTTGPEGSVYTPVAEWGLLQDQPLP